MATEELRQPLGVGLSSGGDSVIASSQGGSPFLEKVSNPTLPRIGSRTAPQPSTMAGTPSSRSILSISGTMIRIRSPAKSPIALCQARYIHWGWRSLPINPSTASSGGVVSGKKALGRSLAVKPLETLRDRCSASLRKGLRPRSAKLRKTRSATIAASTRASPSVRRACATNDRMTPQGTGADDSPAARTRIVPGPGAKALVASRAPSPRIMVILI